MSCPLNNKRAVQRAERESSGRRKCSVAAAADWLRHWPSNPWCERSCLACCTTHMCHLVFSPRRELNECMQAQVRGRNADWANRLDPHEPVGGREHGYGDSWLWHLCPSRFTAQGQFVIPVRPTWSPWRGTKALALCNASQIVRH